MSFLLNNETIIDYKEGLITIEKKTYEVNIKKKLKNEYDTKICDKTKLFTYKEE